VRNGIGGYRLTKVMNRENCIAANPLQIHVDWSLQIAVSHRVPNEIRKYLSHA
jgi:hypothetical protein